MANEYNNNEKEFANTLIDVRRVTKVVKGGKNFRFCALVAVGDQNGKVGIGIGKAMEIPDAIRKAIEDAKKNLIKVPIVDGTIPHQIVGNFGAGKVILIPAQKGTGIIAGGAIRSIMELAGVENIRTKSLGTSNPINMVKAALEGIKSLMTVEEAAALRNKTVEEIIG